VAKPANRSRSRKPAAAAGEAPKAAPEPVAAAPDAGLQPDPDDTAPEPAPKKDRKRGWWSLGR
jgi:hypothetical protein